MLIKNKDFGGKIHSLTPHAEWKNVVGKTKNPNFISDAKYQELIDAHVMFKDMAADPYLKSAGIASDWPCGRGCYQSKDGGFIIWFGEEDQLRIMCMATGFLVHEIFDRLNKALQLVESIDGITFAKSEKYGYVTSCPSNLGTGMRASLHLKLPNLTADGTDKQAKAAAKPLGLSVRGAGGEHTPIGKDGTVDISPSKRLFISEAQIVAALYKGAELLLEKEKEASTSTGATAKAAGGGGCCVVS
jgi:protein-arginine kinase